MANINRLFEWLLQQEGSDLHLLEGQKPKIRQHGQLIHLEDHPELDTHTIRTYLQDICGEGQWSQFLETRDLDFAYDLGEKARFRVNYYFQAHGLGAVFRTIPTRIMTIDELNLPPILKIFAQQRSGLILVTGPTGLRTATIGPYPCHGSHGLGKVHDAGCPSRLYQPAVRALHPHHRGTHRICSYEQKKHLLSA